MRRHDGDEVLLEFARFPRRVQVALGVLVACVVVFGLFLLELTLRSESLHCRAAPGPALACDHVSEWPLVAPSRTPLSPVLGARTARGGGNVELLLEHADRTVSTHAGVGARGERAETVALQMRDQLARGDGERVHALRGGSPPFAIGIFVLLVLLPLVLAPGLVARTRLIGGSSPRVVVRRGVLPPRLLRLSPDAPPELRLESFVMTGETVYVLRLVAEGGSFELLRSRRVEECHALAEKVEGALRTLVRGPDASA